MNREQAELGPGGASPAATLCSSAPGRGSMRGYVLLTFALGF